MSSNWLDLIGDDSNLSMKSVEFRQCEANQACNSRSRFDPELDSSQQGLPLLFKKTKLIDERSNSQLGKRSRSQMNDMGNDDENEDEMNPQSNNINSNNNLNCELPPKAKQRTSEKGHWRRKKSNNIGGASDFSRFLSNVNEDSEKNEKNYKMEIIGDDNSEDKENEKPKMKTTATSGTTTTTTVTAKTTTKKSFADILRFKNSNFESGAATGTALSSQYNSNSFHGFNSLLSNNIGVSSKENSTSVSVLSTGFTGQSIITPSTSVTPNKQNKSQFTILKSNNNVTNNASSLRKQRRQRLTQRRQRKLKIAGSVTKSKPQPKAPISVPETVTLGNEITNKNGGESKSEEKNKDESEEEDEDIDIVKDSGQGIMINAKYKEPDITNETNGEQQDSGQHDSGQQKQQQQLKQSTKSVEKNESTSKTTNVTPFTLPPTTFGSSTPTTPITGKSAIMTNVMAAPNVIPAIPTIPTISTLPPMPGMPGMPSMPSMPAMPNMTDISSIPNISTIPSMVGMPTISGVSTTTPLLPVSSPFVFANNFGNGFGPGFCPPFPISSNAIDVSALPSNANNNHSNHNDDNNCNDTKDNKNSKENSPQNENGKTNDKDTKNGDIPVATPHNTTSISFSYLGSLSAKKTSQSPLPAPLLPQLSAFSTVSQGSALDLNFGGPLTGMMTNNRPKSANCINNLNNNNNNSNGIIPRMTPLYALMPVYLTSPPPPTTVTMNNSLNTSKNSNNIANNSNNDMKNNNNNNSGNFIPLTSTTLMNTIGPMSLGSCSTTNVSITSSQPVTTSTNINIDDDSGDSGENNGENVNSNDDNNDNHSSHNSSEINFLNDKHLITNSKSLSTRSSTTNSITLSLGNIHNNNKHKNNNKNKKAQNSIDSIGDLINTPRMKLEIPEIADKRQRQRKQQKLKKQENEEEEDKGKENNTTTNDEYGGNFVWGHRKWCSNESDNDNNLLKIKENSWANKLFPEELKKIAKTKKIEKEREVAIKIEKRKQEILIEKANRSILPDKKKPTVCQTYFDEYEQKIQRQKQQQKQQKQEHEPQPQIQRQNSLPRQHRNPWVKKNSSRKPRANSISYQSPKNHYQFGFSSQSYEHTHSHSHSHNHHSYSHSHSKKTTPKPRNRVFNKHNTFNSERKTSYNNRNYGYNNGYDNYNNYNNNYHSRQYNGWHTPKDTKNGNGNKNRNGSTNDSSRCESVAGSITSENRSKSISIKPIDVTDAALTWREKQITMGKNTDGYKNYIKTIPRDERNLQDPQTPDPKERIGKKRFVGKLHKWRHMLHSFDSQSNNNEKNENENPNPNPSSNANEMKNDIKIDDNNKEDKDDNENENELIKPQNLNEIIIENDDDNEKIEKKLFSDDLESIHH